MSLRTEKIIGIIMLAIMAGFALWGQANISETQMAVHFDLNGSPNGFAPTKEGVWILPGISAVVMGLMLWVLPHIMPKSASIDRFPGVYGLMVLSIFALLTVTQAMLILSAAGMAIDHIRIAFSGIGLLFIILGNFMPKMRKNWLIGIRTPWTLSDDRVWDRTHRFAGPLFVLGGLITLLGALFAPVTWRSPLLIGSVLIVTVVSYGYSYFAARRLKLV